MEYKLILALNDMDFSYVLGTDYYVDIPDDERGNVNDALLCELWYNDWELFSEPNRA